MRKKEFCESCKSHLTNEDSVRCNKCGDSCHIYGPGRSVQLCGLIDAKVYGHYLSPILNDLTIYKFDLCEKCLKEMFDSFKILVEEGHYNLITGLEE